MGFERILKREHHGDAEMRFDVEKRSGMMLSLGCAGEASSSSLLLHSDASGSHSSPRLGSADQAQPLRPPPVQKVEKAEVMRKEKLSC